MNGTEDRRTDEEFDRLLLLLTSTPREGFEFFYTELTRREVERLFASADIVSKPDEGGDGKD